MHTQKHSTTKDSIGRMLSLLLVLNSVASVINEPITAIWSFGSNDTVVVKTGDHVTLRCSAESREGTCLVWNYETPASNSLTNDDRQLSDCKGVIKEHDRNGSIAVKTEGNVSVLTITNIKSEYAGQYECQDTYDNEAIFSKKLIVIDDHPRCSSTYHKYFDNKKITNGSENQRGSKMELHCEVEFNGKLDATNQCILEWRIEGREDVLNSSKTKCIVGDKSVKSTLTLNAASHSNDTSYVCVVRGSPDEQNSCETGQIETACTGPTETPLTGTIETPLTSPTETPLTSPTETPLTSPIETPLTGTMETPLTSPTETRSPTCKCSEDVPKVQPESANELVWRQCFTCIFVDHQLLLHQQTRLNKMSELVKIQSELLSVERKILKLEKSKSNVLPPRRR